MYKLVNKKENKKTNRSNFRIIPSGFARFAIELSVLTRGSAMIENQGCIRCGAVSELIHKII